MPNSPSNAPLIWYCARRVELHQQMNKECHFGESNQLTECSRSRPAGQGVGTRASEPSQACHPPQLLVCHPEAQLPGRQAAPGGDKAGVQAAHPLCM